MEEGRCSRSGTRLGERGAGQLWRSGAADLAGVGGIDTGGKGAWSPADGERGGWVGEKALERLDSSKVLECAAVDVGYRSYSLLGARSAGRGMPSGDENRLCETSKAPELRCGRPNGATTNESFSPESSSCTGWLRSPRSREAGEGASGGKAKAPEARSAGGRGGGGGGPGGGGAR